MIDRVKKITSNIKNKWRRIPKKFIAFSVLIMLVWSISLAVLTANNYSKNLQAKNDIGQQARNDFDKLVDELDLKIEEIEIEIINSELSLQQLRHLSDAQLLQSSVKKLKKVNDTQEIIDILNYTVDGLQLDNQKKIIIKGIDDLEKFQKENSKLNQKLDWRSVLICLSSIISVFLSIIFFYQYKYSIKTDKKVSKIILCTLICMGIVSAIPLLVNEFYFRIWIVFLTIWFILVFVMIRETEFNYDIENMFRDKEFSINCWNYFRQRANKELKLNKDFKNSRMPSLKELEEVKCGIRVAYTDNIDIKHLIYLLEQKPHSTNASWQDMTKIFLFFSNLLKSKIIIFLLTASGLAYVVQNTIQEQANIWFISYQQTLIEILLIGFAIIIFCFSFFYVGLDIYKSVGSRRYKLKQVENILPKLLKEVLDEQSSKK